MPNRHTAVQMHHTHIRFDARHTCVGACNHAWTHNGPLWHKQVAHENNTATMQTRKRTCARMHVRASAQALTHTLIIPAALFCFFCVCGTMPGMKTPNKRKSGDGLGASSGTKVRRNNKSSGPLPMVDSKSLK
eukprot:6199836-Alexandrium_andersonii.AAC.1